MAGESLIKRYEAWTKTIVNALVIAGVISGIILFPLKSRMEGIDKTITKIQEEHQAHCEESKTEMDEKISEDTMVLYIAPIESAIGRLEKKIDANILKQEKFQDKIVDFIMNGVK